MSGGPQLPRAGTLQARIVRLMRETPGRVWRPCQLATKLDANPGSVRKALQRLVDDPPGEVCPIVRVTRGVYRAFRDADQAEGLEAPNPKVHGIKVVSRMPRNRGWGVSRGRPENYGSISEQTGWSRDDTNGSIHTTRVFRGRRVKVRCYSSTGTVEVGVSASEDPFDPGEFGGLVSWLEGFLAGQGLAWDSEGAMVQSVELNVDYQSLALRGVKAMKLRNWTNAWVQAYQKENDRMRAEVRVEDPGLSVVEMESIFGKWLEAAERARLASDEGVGESEPSVDVERPADDREVI